MKRKTFVFMLALCFPWAAQAQLIPAKAAGTLGKKTSVFSSKTFTQGYKLPAAAVKSAQIKYDNALEVYNKNPILENRQNLEKAQRELSFATKQWKQQSPRANKTENLQAPREPALTDQLARTIQRQAEMNRRLLIYAAQTGDLPAIQKLLREGKVTPMEALRVSLAREDITYYLLKTYYQKSPATAQTEMFTTQLKQEGEELVYRIVKNDYDKTLPLFRSFLLALSPNELKELVQITRENAQIFMESQLVEHASTELTRALLWGEFGLAEAHVNAKIVSLNQALLNLWESVITTGSYSDEAVLFLINHGADVNTRLGLDFNYRTVLQQLMLENRDKLVLQAFEHGGDLSLADGAGNNAIFYALHDPQMLRKVFEQIIKHPEYLPELQRQNAAGRTPLQEAKHRYYEWLIDYFYSILNYLCL